MTKFSKLISMSRINNHVSQKEVVLNHLMSGRNLTQVTASALYRVQRLASRIHELTKEGYDFKRIRCVDVTGTPYIMYRLAGAYKQPTNPSIDGII